MRQKIIYAILMTLITAMSLSAQQQKVDVVGDENYVNGPRLHYDGIDVSSYQKDIDWSTTAADKNIKFVYVKATEGATHQSRHYRRNIEHARRHGVKVGSYHFLRTTSSIDAQFANFISIVKTEEQDIVPLIDVETRRGWSNKQLQDSVKKFADLIEAHYGVRPMIYTSSSFFNAYLGADFASYPLFIARYSKSEPTLQFGAKWTLWQFSDRGRIQGIDAYVDLCRFNRGCTVKDLLWGNNRSGKRGKVGRGNTVPQTVPEPKKKQQAKPEVPKSDKQKKEEERRRKEEEKQRKKLEKEQKKAAEKQRKEEEKRRKEEEKKRKEAAKKASVPEPQKPKTQPKQAVPMPNASSASAGVNDASTVTGTTTDAPRQAAPKRRNNQSSADNDKTNYSTRKGKGKTY